MAESGGAGCIKLIFLRGHALSTDLKTEKLKEKKVVLPIRPDHFSTKRSVYIPMCMYVHISFHIYMHSASNWFQNVQNKF